VTLSQTQTQTWVADADADADEKLLRVKSDDFGSYAAS
jgi:hypothetical protein